MPKIFLKSIIAAMLGLLLAIPLHAEEGRNRSAFTKGKSTSREIIKHFNPVQRPGNGNEISIYLPVQFAYNSARLSTTARRNLRTIARALLSPQLRHVTFIVEGHTDARGTRSYNRYLSLRRANAAMNYLMKQGVSKWRLSVRGLGEEDLLYDYSPYASAQRRVEFVRSF